MNANMLATYYYVLAVTTIMLTTCIVIALPNNALTKHYTYKKKHIHSLIDSVQDHLSKYLKENKKHIFVCDNSGHNMQHHFLCTCEILHV